jgi:GNAT superfamily N-acetyltransferase
MLFLSPSLWGAGDAARLLADACASMLLMGYAGTCLWTMAGNAHTRRFYEREGLSWDGGERYHPIYRQDMVRLVKAFS